MLLKRVEKKLDIESILVYGIKRNIGGLRCSFRICLTYKALGLITGALDVALVFD